MPSSTYSLFDDFAYRGRWWIPENPENRVSGSLYFSKDGGISLELSGSLGPRYRKPTRESFNPEIILGIAGDGDYCTLLNNTGMSSTFRNNSEASSQFTSSYLLVGQHFVSKEDIRFSAFRANYTYLEMWSGQSAFDVQPIKEDDCHLEFNIRYSPSLLVDANISLPHGRIKVFQSYIRSGNQYTNLSLKNQCFLEFCPEEPQAFEHYWHLFRDIKNLLTLMMGELVHPRRIQGIIDEEDCKGNDRDAYIDVFFQQDRAFLNERTHRYNMLITLPQLQSSGNVSEVFENWFANSERLRSVYDLFFGCLYSPDMYARFRFLSLTQALESLHRSSKQGKYLSDEDYEAYEKLLINALPEGMPSDLKSALRNRIKYGNEYSLRKRLKELFDTLDDELQQLISPKPEAFINRVVTLRNHLTHYSEDDSSLDPDKLFYLTQRLITLLTIVLLKSLGLSEPSVKSVLVNSSNTKLLAWNQLGNYP